MDFIGSELNWLFFILKIILSIVCGIIIGIERETMGKPAGIKTHSLICLGSCLFTHFSLLSTAGDPTRIAAQVVSGIGFIGAGTILQSKQRIEGLTSAALVFVNAAIGMTIGGGYFMSGIVATGSLLILFQFIRTNKFQTKLRSYRIYIRCETYSDIEETMTLIQKLQCKVTNKKIEKSKKHIELSLTYLTTPLANHRILAKLNQLRSIKGFSQL
ncbi:MAG: MgtC/SapB family protein [Candidatus Marinamargulisbacteria bacterium]